MQYFGGKHKLKAKLQEAILPLAQGRRIVEPFCGGLSATVALQPALASDASVPLINLIIAARAGWRPPTTLPEEEYFRLKRTQDPKDPLTAFVGHGMSFGAKWFAGYARGNVSMVMSWNGLKRKLDATKDVEFRACSYADLDIHAGDVVYCDPPYDGTTHGYPTGKWDRDAFWVKMDDWANAGALVFVSEFSAPEDVKIFREWEHWSAVDGHNTGTRKTVERLYVLGRT